MTVNSKITYTTTLDDESMLIGIHTKGKLHLGRKQAGTKQEIPVVLTRRDAERLGVILCKFLKAEEAGL